MTIVSGGVAGAKTLAATIADALAKGETVGTGSSDGIGVGVSINLINITNKATTGIATITATGLDIEAGMNDKNDGRVRFYDSTAKEWTLINRGTVLPVSPSNGDYFQLTEGAPAATAVDGASQDVGASPHELKVKSTTGFASAGTFTAAGIDGTCTYTGTSGGNKFTGISGCTGTPDDKAQVTSTTGTTVHGDDQVIDGSHTTLNVISTANFDTTGAFTGEGIDGTCSYTNKTTTSFSGVTGCTGSPDDGAAITRVLTPPGIYKWNGTTWVVQSGTIGHGTELPASPAGGDLFRLAEHEIISEAGAGAGKTDVGIAGAVAINITSTDLTQALVGAGSHVTASSADVTVKAQSNELDLAKAESEAEDASSVGVGAAVALNILTATTETRAEVEDGAVLTGGVNVDVEAASRRQAETEVESGASGDDTSVAPGVALLLITSEHTTARLGTSATDLTATGAITVKATHEGEYSSEAKAVAAGSTAVGASIALNIVLDWNTLAEVARNITGSSVDVTADTSVASEAKADATASGAKKGGDDADKKKQSEVDNNPNTTGKAGTLPKASDSNTGTGKGSSETSAQGGDSNSGGVGVAASISLNWVVTKNTAKIDDAVHVTASGAVKVSAENSSQESAKATGLSASADGTHVAAAVGVNFADVTNNATVGQDAVVSGGGITIEAVNKDGKTNQLIVWGLAGSGGSSEDNGGASVAASIGVEVVFFHTEASVAQGAHLISNAGVEVHAENAIGIQNMALSGAASAGGAGVGGAIVVNVFPDITTEAIINSGTSTHVTQIDAVGAIEVSAKSSIKEADPIKVPIIGTLPAFSSVAMAAAASSGGAAVSGSVIVDVLFITTTAQISSGTQINQNQGRLTGTPTSGTQTLKVEAIDDTSLTNIAGGLNFSTDGAGVGIGIDVDVINKHVSATIQSQTTITTLGGIDVNAASTEHFHELALDVGGSSDNAAVDGSVIVVVLSPSNTSAEVSGTVHAGDSFNITASDAMTDFLLAGGGAVSTSSAGVAVSVIVIDRTATVDAGVGANSDLQANGGTGLTVSATQSEDVDLISVGAAGGDSAGVAGSVIVDIQNNSTLAHIDSGVTVGGSTTGVAVSATDTTTILALAGTIGIGGTAGVGVGVDVEAISKDTEASTGNGGHITVSGNVTVAAKSKETITSISVGGGFGGTASVNVQAAVPVISVTTKACVADGSGAPNGEIISAGGSGGGTADEVMTLNVIAGNISGGGSAAVGAAVSVPVVSKETHAWIGNFAQVGAAGNSAITVPTGTYTVTSEDTRFDPQHAITGGNTINIGYTGNLKNGDEVRYDNGGGTSVTGLTDGALYYVKVLGDGQSVQLFGDPSLSGSPIGLSGGIGENHRLVPTNQAGVTKDTSNRFNPLTGNDVDYTSNEITLPYLSSISTGDAVIYSSGGGTPIGGLVDGGEYYAIVDVSGNPTKLRLATTRCGAVTHSVDSDCANTSVQVIDLTDPGPNAGKSHSIVPSGKTPSGDASALGPRVIAEQTGSFRGVAVTANNSDNVGAFGISFGFSGSAAVNLAGVINIENINTSAHIGDAAMVDCGATCASNVGGANIGQSVRVAAANQYYELEVAASLAIGGDAGVAVPITVRIVNVNTWAYIGNGASVNARNDVSVTANASESVIGVTAGAGGGTVGVAGTVSVTVVTVNTYACTGTPTSPSFKCDSNGATINAGNNVLVSANDTSRFVLVTVAVAGGFVGVGLAVGVAVLNKDTEAYLGAGSVVNAQATGSSISSTIPDGTFNATSQRYNPHVTYSGLAVESASSEDVFGLAPAVAGGFVGVAGGVGVTVMNVSNQAFIGPQSQINLAGGAGSAQSVNVTALDYFKSLTIAGGIAGGFVGVAGGVDIGIADTSAQAHIGEGSTVYAVLDVEVFGLSRKEVQTYALSASGGFVGVALAVSVWSVGTQTNSNYQDSGSTGPDKGTWSATGSYNAGDVVTGSDGKRYTARCDIGGTWQSSTKYNKCRILKDGANEYQALVDNPNQGVNPAANGAQWVLYTPTDPSGDSANWDGPTDALHSPGQDTGQSIGSADSTASGSSESAPDWVSGTAYNAGDKVTFKGHVFKARVNITHVSTDPDQNDDSTSGTFNEWSQEAGGYTSALSGTTSTATVNAWVSGTSYHRGDEVSYNGSKYTANVDITLPADVVKTPDKNTAQWANADSQNKTSSRISAALGNPQTKINAAATKVGGSVATNAINRVPNGGTTATIDSSLALPTTVIAGRHVKVLANDVLFVFGIAGAAAGGFVGVGGSVLVLNVKSVTDAGVSPYASIGAGGAVTISASMDEHSTPIGFAAGFGAVGVGAQVAVVNDTGTQNAHIDDNAQVTKAPGGLSVTVNATRDVHAYAIGAAFGAGAIGAAVAVVNVDGDASATIGNVAVGGTTALGGLTVGAVDHITSDTLVIAVAGGIGLGLGAAVAVINLGGTLKATSGAHRSRAGAVNITADGTHTAKVTSVNVATGAGAVGITVDVINNSRNTETGTSGSGITFTTPAAVTVRATASNLVEADAPGGAAGGVAISIIVADAQLSGHTTTDVEGGFTNANGITISAIADNTATATTTIFGVAVIGLSGGVAVATIQSGADIETTVGSGATLDGGSGAVVVEAKTRNAGNQANATAQGGTAGLLFAGTLFVGVATIDASVEAHMNGQVTGGSSLDVNANGVNDAEAHTIAGAVSLGGALAGSVSYANIASDAHVVADAASTAEIVIGESSTVEATGTNTANATSEVISFGLISLGVSVPTSTIGASTTAGYDGSVTGGSGLTVKATGADTATVDSKPIAIGLVAGNGAAADAEITNTAQVDAGVGKDAVLTLNSATAKVQTSVNNSATATLNSDAFGGLAVSIMFAEVHDRGGSHASFDGQLVSGSQLTVQTDVTRAVDSHMFVLAIALAASAASADAKATIGDDAASNEEASLGGDTNIHSNGTAITIKASRSASAFSEANGGAGGLLGSGALMQATTKVQGSVQAFAADGATIGTNAGKLANAQMTAVDNSTAVANATVGSGAIGFTAGGSVTDAEVTPTVNAYLGNVHVNVAGDFFIQANSNDAEADATAKSYGGALGLHIGAPLSTAKSQPAVHAYISAGSTIVTGGKVTVDAEANATGNGVPLTDFITGMTPGWIGHQRDGQQRRLHLARPDHGRPGAVSLQRVRRHRRPARQPRLRRDRRRQEHAAVRGDFQQRLSRRRQCRGQHPGCRHQSRHGSVRDRAQSRDG